MKKRTKAIILISLLVALFAYDRVYIYDSTGKIQERAKEINGNKDLPPREFKTDGCTLWPDNFLGYSLQEECIEHDIYYWVGGSEEERLQADLKLRDGINKSYPGLGDILFIGVRAGGRSLSSLIPWPWGWGYGWNNNGTTSLDVVFDKAEELKNIELINF